jgi:hypothetical protein
MRLLGSLLFFLIPAFSFVFHGTHSTDFLSGFTNKYQGQGLETFLELSWHLLIPLGQEMLSTPEGRSFSKQDGSNKGVCSLHQLLPPPLSCILMTLGRKAILENLRFFEHGLSDGACGDFLVRGGNRWSGNRCPF